MRDIAILFLVSLATLAGLIAIGAVVALAEELVHYLAEKRRQRKYGYRPPRILG